MTQTDQARIKTSREAHEWQGTNLAGCFKVLLFLWGHKKWQKIFRSAKQCQKVFSEAHEWQSNNLEGFKNVSYLLLREKKLINLVRKYNGKNILVRPLNGIFFGEVTIKLPVH